jgi:hypothetical protein
MEVIRPDEEPVLKTGGGHAPLVGSSPTASADGPVVQRHDFWLTSRQRRFDSFRDYLRPSTPTAERVGLNPNVCRFDSCLGHCGGSATWLGRQLADHLGLEPGMTNATMLRTVPVGAPVRIPPELLNIYVLVEQPGVLATLSRWRSRVQIPPGTLFVMNAARYANGKSGEAQTFVNVCGFDSRLCHLSMRRLGIGVPKWL